MYIIKGILKITNLTYLEELPSSMKWNETTTNAPINVMPDPREGGQTQGHLTFSIFLCQ
jgi:hypothetical protein